MLNMHCKLSLCGPTAGTSSTLLLPIAKARRALGAVAALCRVYALTRIDTAVTAEHIGGDTAHRDGYEGTSTEQFDTHDGAGDGRVRCAREDRAKTNRRNKLSIDAERKRKC
jgi:hypothetical protein